MEEARIRVGGDGFEILAPDRRPILLAFDEVSEVVAYKRDMLTTDLVCFQISVPRLSGDVAYEVHEEMEGCSELLERLCELPGFDSAWADKVILPPFKANRTLIFKRSAAGSAGMA